MASTTLLKALVSSRPEKTMCLTPTCKRRCHSGAWISKLQAGMHSHACEQLPGCSACDHCHKHAAQTQHRCDRPSTGQAGFSWARLEGAAGQARLQCQHQNLARTQHRPSHVVLWLCSTHPCTSSPLHHHDTSCARCNTLRLWHQCTALPALQRQQRLCPAAVPPWGPPLLLL